MSAPEQVRILPTDTYFQLVRQSLADTGSAYVRVTGNSMRPLLRHLRDGVILAPPRGVRPGDIVLFDRRDGRYALHRVIRVEGSRFTMAGDNQWHLERDLPLEQIVGVAVELERKGRRIPCRSFRCRMYAGLVTFLAFPRIKIRRGIALLGKPFHSGRTGKGARP